MPGTDLLERDAELTTLSELLAATGKGASGVAVIEGEAGIGKTALVRAVEQAGRTLGMTVCSASSHQVESGFALGVVRQVFEPVLRASGEAGQAAIFTDSAGLAASLLSHRTLQATPEAAASMSFAALHSLYWLTANLAARGPLLITVDDVQWADEPSRRWLAHLARRLGDLPVLMVLAVNTSEQGGEGALDLGVGGNTEHRVLRPGRLGPPSTARLVRQTLDAGAADVFCDACHTATGGNPLLLRELLRDLRAQGVAPTEEAAHLVRRLGPRAVARSVFARLARLDPSAAALARAVAVLGEPVELRLAAAVGELDEQVAATAAEALIDSGLFQAGRPLGFVHPIVRAAVYRGLQAGARSAAHLRAARAMAGERVPAERVAAHLLATQPAGDRWTPVVLREAASGASGRGAPELAIAYLDRALREPPPDELRADLLVELGRLRLPLDPPAALQNLAQGMELASDVRCRARAAGALTRVLMVARRPHDAVALVEQVLGGIGPADAEVGLRLENTLIAIAVFDLATTRLGRERLERPVQALDGDGGAAMRTREALRAIVASWSGRSAAQTTGLARQVLAGVVLDDDEEEGALIRLLAVATLLQADQLDLAQRHCDRVISEASRRGWIFLQVVARYLRGQVQWRRGALDGALTDARAALDLAGPEIWGPMHGLPVAGLLDVLLERGETAAATDVLRRNEFLGELPEVWTSNLLLYGRGQLRVASGQVRTGLDDLLEAGRRLDAFGATNPAIVPWRAVAALAARALGEHEQARRLAGEEVTLAHRWGAPRTVGIALRAAGRVTDGPEGMALLQQAVTVLEPAQAPIELARSLTDLGAALRRAGQRQEARVHLRRALDLAQRCSATALAEQAQHELLASGARPRRLHQSGLDALTSTERRTAALAAQGRTNREIALAQFVTQRTVELHLTSAYRKLGISGRSQLVAALQTSENPSVPP